jgi:hypothetical protein
VTPAALRALQVLAAGGQLLRPWGEVKSYQVCDPSRPEAVVWLSKKAGDQLMDEDYITRAHLTAPIKLTPKGRRAARSTS